MKFFFKPVDGLFLLKVLTAVALFAAPAVSFAQLIVGAEFEFVDPQVPIIPGRGAELKGHESLMAERFARAFRQTCPPSQCVEERHMGKWGVEYRFHLPDGFWIQVSIDPNVVEIQTRPAEREYLAKNAKTLQQLIWGSAEKARLVVDPARRAGHFNFSALEAFNNKTSDFLKFFVDFANRPELSNGIFRQTNLLNAPHLAHLGSDQREGLSQLVEEFQKTPPRTRMRDWMNPFRKKHASLMSIPEMAEALAKRVLFRSTNPQNDGWRAWHYQALGLKSLVGLKPGESAPLELRAVRSQRDIYDFLLLAELIEKRIEYLVQLPQEISFRVSQTTKTTFSPAELVDRFYIYVTETDLPWERYQRLLPPELAQLKPHALLTEKNFSRDFFADVERLKNLADLLPTSPWLERQMKSLLSHPELPAEHRRVLLSEINRLSASPEYSPKMKTALQDIAARFSAEIPRAVNACHRVFAD